MPTIFTKDGFRFFFYSNDHTPIHIHVKRGDGEAVFEVEGEVVLRESVGMNTKELAKAEEEKAPESPVLRDSLPAEAVAEKKADEAERVKSDSEKETKETKEAQQPKETEATMGRTIVVRLNENRLYLYDGFDAVRSYSVATAKPGFTTPTGVWTIYDKKENPTWYNPAEDTWGADLPPVIEPGPGNPLGTRAIYLNAPGIRIHGTYSSSSIGTYASHGCIRMYISDSEELFDLVDMGTRVIIKP